MRIGILTLPLHTNYGGILQAWALQTVLQRMGHEVEVLGIEPVNNHAWYTMPIVWGIRAVRKCMGQYQSPIFYEHWKHKEEQHKFKHIINFTRKRINHCIIGSLEELNKTTFDGIVVGSDQIWREDYIRMLWHCQNSDYAFLFQLHDKNLLKFTYAASFGIDEWTFDKTTTKKIRQALQDFTGISVRETSAIGLLNSNVGINSMLVCDPTMLISAEEYQRLLNIDDGHSSGIVSYILDPDNFSKALINKIETENGENITEINAFDKDGTRLSVERWIEMIATSRMVVTNSFHGCVFSLIFRKPLVFFGNISRGNARFKSLIETYGLSEHFITNIDEFDQNKSYGLSGETESKIEELISTSKDFLATQVSHYGNT